MKNELLAMMLMKVYVNEELFSFDSPDVKKYFENDGYETRNVAKEDLKDVLTSSAMTAFKLDCIRRGFKAGVDAALMTMGKEPAFGVLDDYVKDWTEYNDYENSFDAN